MKKGFTSALLVSAALLAATPVFAADAPKPGPGMAAHDGHMHHGPRVDPALMAEGHIAFLRAVLQITPAQSAQFDKLAGVIRKHAADRAAVMQKWAQGHHDDIDDDDDGKTGALEKLDRMSERLAQHEKHLTELKAALAPLYASLSPAQKATADALLADGPMMMHHMGGIR